jgi:hypothetical protein
MGTYVNGLSTKKRTLLNPEVSMRGMGHSDPIETVNVTHEEGNEGEKIGVKRGIGGF